MQGASTPSTEKADQFAEAVAARLPGVQLFRIDERLTTVSAQKRLHETGASIAASRSRIDSAAAVVLLEHFLESHHA
jgi:putative Holliday junction resolvase